MVREANCAAARQVEIGELKKLFKFFPV